MWNKAFHCCRKCKTKWAWAVWGTRYLNCPTCKMRMTDEEVKFALERVMMK